MFHVKHESDAISVGPKMCRLPLAAPYVPSKTESGLHAIHLSVFHVKQKAHRLGAFETSDKPCSTWNCVYICGETHEPMSTNLALDRGILIGSCQSQSIFLRRDSTSPSPKSKITLPSVSRDDRAQFRSAPYFPRARTVMMFSFRDGVHSSIRHRMMSTSDKESSRTISPRKAIFFVTDSTKDRCNRGETIRIGMPGKPGPVPMSATRPEEIPPTHPAKRLSPKCTRRISSGSVTVVSDIFEFHCKSVEMYILICSQSGVFTAGQ